MTTTLKYTNQDLRELQLVMLEILKMFDEFCSTHKLKYSLYGGTMIGAVRHHGFIPWDDDVDVCMEREDYERFIKLWQDDPIDGYFLQNKETDENFTQTFSKIRKNGTTFLQFESERGKLHTGIFIDIFPHDHIPKSRFKRRLYQYYALKNQLYTREFIPPKANLFMKIFCWFLLACTTHKQRMSERKKLKQYLMQYNKMDIPYDIASTSSMGGVMRPFPEEIWKGECIRMKFEDFEFSCAPGWKVALHHEFGDYMKLPPEESRQWKHHPIILDFCSEIK